MSNTEAWFATPVYNVNIIGSGLDQIQKDFDRAFESLKQQGKFDYTDEWGATTLFSDTKFDDNLLKDFNIQSFNLELDLHIKRYLSQIGFVLHPKLGYDVKASWMTLSRKGNYGHIHSHGAADLSGVYYFKTNGEDGNLFFETPNKLLTSSFCFNHMHNRAYFKPEVGKLLLFPGWLEHGVQTNTTDNERVSVSFNIHFDR
jgi:uncharacterized protein (TIGR02466 family)